MTAPTPRERQAALLAAATALLATPVVIGSNGRPDAELIAASRRFAAIERFTNARFAVCRSVEDEEEAEREIEPLEVEQLALVDRLTALRPATWAGHRERAAAFVAWDGPTKRDTTGVVGDRLILAITRDLVMGEPSA